MSLRVRLLLLLGALMAALTVTQWLMVRQLTGRTMEEFAGQTLRISRQLVEFFNREVLVDPEMRAEEAPNPLQETDSETVEKVPADRRLVKILDYRIDQRELGEVTANSEKLLLGGEDEEFEVSLHTGSSGGALSFLSKGPQDFRLRVRSPRHQKDIEVSSEAFQAGFESLSRQLLLGTFGILALGLAVGVFAANRMLRPLRELADAAGEISGGRLGLQISSRGGGEIDAAIGAFNQMSLRLERYDRERRLWQERKHLQELGEIAKGLAHTIRNPLNTLGLSLEELAGRCDSADPEVEELTLSARLQIGRVDQWIRSFLALASGAGRLEGEVDLGGLVRDIVLEFVQESRARISIRERDFDALPPLRGVEAELRGMIQALVANAVEATDGKGSVRIGVAQQDGAVRLEVRDDGPGVPESVIRQLFSPHVSTKPRGAGMGLYLTHRLVRSRYGGGLELSTAAEGGAVAVLTLRDRRESAPGDVSAPPVEKAG